MSARTLTPAALAAFAFALLVCAGGCTRKTQLVPASSDSTGARVDSFSVYARQATARWESGLNDEAARLTARVLREALEARPNAPWVERVHGVLDSLGLAADVAGGDRAVVANLFARSDPDGGSWPFLFWRDQTSVRFQALDNSGLHLEDVATRAFATKASRSDAALGDSAQVAVLWGRRVGGGRQPTLMTWGYRRGRWDLVQTLAPDSLGGTGTGEFTAADTGRALTVRTYRPTPYFDECATCPHVFHERAYAWRTTGFTRQDDRAVPSPYGTFAMFIAALIAGDRELANLHVVDRSLIDFARRYDWHSPARGRWRVAPATDEGGAEIVFLRGPGEAYRVRFEPRDGDWVIAGFEATTRTIE